MIEHITLVNENNVKTGEAEKLLVLQQGLIKL